MEDFDQMADLADADIIAKINTAAQYVSPGVDFWYSELSRRESMRSSERAEAIAVRSERLMRVAAWLAGGSVLLSLVAVLTTVLR